MVGVHTRVGVRAARWAVVAGVAGLVANVLLILFFASAQPWRAGTRGSSWSGAANDAVVVVQFVALVPVALALRERLGGRLLRGVTVAAVVAMVAVAVLQLMLLADVISFDVQVLFVTGCIAVAFAWVLVAAGRGLPRGVARFGRVIAVSFFLGAAVLGVALLLPSGSAGQVGLFVFGGAVGLVGWLGFPVWPLMLAGQVFKEER